MQKRKLLVFLAVWKRPEITEICFLGLNRLRKHPDYDINVLAVISEESMIPLCEKYDVNWVMHENLPLGRKKNYGLKESLRFDWEYLIEIGSDDILKDEFLSLYPFDRDVLTLHDFIQIDTRTNECRRQTCRHAYFGAGRSISRKAIERVKELWNDYLNEGLDNFSTARLSRYGFMEKRIKSSEPVIVSLKGSVNIWPFRSVGIEYPIENALQGLSEEELNAIACLNQSLELAS